MRTSTSKLAALTATLFLFAGCASSRTFDNPGISFEKTKQISKTSFRKYSYKIIKEKQRGFKYILYGYKPSQLNYITLGMQRIWFEPEPPSKGTLTLDYGKEKLKFYISITSSRFYKRKWEIGYEISRHIETEKRILNKIEAMIKEEEKKKHRKTNLLDTK